MRDWERAPRSDKVFSIRTARCEFLNKGVSFLESIFRTFGLEKRSTNSEMGWRLDLKRVKRFLSDISSFLLKSFCKINIIHINKYIFIFITFQM